MTRDAVHLYAACWNEVEMLGFFFRHYDPWVDRYVMYDDGSTDGTLDILRGHPNVDLRTLDRTDPDSLWRSHTAMLNSAWKQSRDVADWVVLADIDEHLHLAGGADVRSYLAAQRELGVTLIPALGFNMVSLDLPADEGRLVDVVRRGNAARDFNKLAVFDPDAVEETTVADGRHVAAPSGRLLLPARDELMLCHFKRLGLRHWQGRADELAERLGPGDREDGLGVHYLVPREYRVERWPTILAESIEVNGHGFVADQEAEGPLWWAGLERVSAAPVTPP